MQETANFLTYIFSGLSSLTVVGLIGLIVILGFVLLKTGVVKAEWFAIKGTRDEKLDAILGFLEKFETNDFPHTCQTEDMKKMTITMDRIMVSLERTSELMRQVTYNQRELCDKIDNHDKQARDILNICNNIWNKKCNAST